MKTFYIKTLGCKVNQYESQIIRENFTNKGYIESEDIDGADIYVVNTCTVTSLADSKSLRIIHNALKKNKCVVVSGCMVEDKDLELRQFRGAEFIIRNKDKYRIPDFITRIEQDGNRIPQAEHRKMQSGIASFKAHTRCFVKIQDGCNNRCSYCKVRIVRGPSTSRPFREIVEECKRLIKKGVKEIVLTGICLGAYGRESAKSEGMCELIKELCIIDGDWRLRLSSIEPKDIDEVLINQLCRERRLCKHLHIPFQSGDNYILNKMKRPYTKTDYLNIVNRLRDVIPDIAITTDIMVGFPGETEKRFQNTIDFVRDVRPMRIHIFPFSKRKGTIAYSYVDDVSEDIKRQRQKKLSLVANELSRRFVEGFVNKDVELLVEGRRSIDGRLQGYTDRYIKLYIDGDDSLKGQFLRFSLSRCLINDVSQRIIGI